MRTSRVKNKRLTERNMSILNVIYPYITSKLISKKMKYKTSSVNSEKLKKSQCQIVKNSMQPLHMLTFYLALRMKHKRQSPTHLNIQRQTTLPLMVKNLNVNFTLRKKKYNLQGPAKPEPRERAVKVLCDSLEK